MYLGSVQLPSLAALRSFESAARHLSFRAAADELSVTQSAISHQVAELERRLGVSLFTRHSRRVELTTAGELYHPYLREAFERIAQGTALVTVRAAARELDVQVYVTVAVRWLIPRLHSFRSAHPDIVVRFNASHLDWEFDDAAGDVAIVCTEQPHRAHLHSTHLFDASSLDAGVQPGARARWPRHAPAGRLGESCSAPALHGRRRMGGVAAGGRSSRGARPECALFRLVPARSRSSHGGAGRGNRAEIPCCR